MSSQADPPHKSTRRSRRYRRSAGTTSSHMPPSQDADFSAEAISEKQAEQRTRILCRGEKGLTPRSAPAVNLQLPPHTPPRPRSMYEGSTIKQHTSNVSTPEISRNRKRTPKSRGSKQSGSASPMPTPNGTPISASRTQSMTPNRTTETWAKAYAGPTFHASPAASALPMPKFFSKSVPTVDKTSSLKAMMEQEAPDTTSGSEGSPSQENAQPALDHRDREGSPLDIFFRADREAKAKAKAHSTEGPAMEGQDDQARLRTTSSGPQTPARHHSRHPTDSSNGGIFSLEMDGASSDHSSTLNSSTPHDQVYSEQPIAQKSSGVADAARKEEQRRAQTLALKQLLYSPRPQLSHNSSADHRPPSSGLRREVAIPASPTHTGPQETPNTPTPSRVYNYYSAASSRAAQSQHNRYTSPYNSFSSSKVSSQASNTSSARDNRNEKSMEDDLRRILKLDVLGGDSITPIQS